MNVVVDHFGLIVQYVCFFPYFVKSSVRCSHQPVQTVIETVFFSVPCSTLTARNRVHFNNFGIEAIHGSIYTCRQAGNTAAYDYDFLLSHWLNFLVFKLEQEFSANVSEAVC